MPFISNEVKRKEITKLSNIAFKERLYYIVYNVVLRSIYIYICTFVFPSMTLIYLSVQQVLALTFGIYNIYR